MEKLSDLNAVIKTETDKSIYPEFRRELIRTLKDNPLFRPKKAIEVRDEVGIYGEEYPVEIGIQLFHLDMRKIRILGQGMYLFKLACRYHAQDIPAEIVQLVYVIGTEAENCRNIPLL